MSIAKRTLNYGNWPSPISAALAGAGGRNITQLRCDGGALYWVESRPEEGGRQTLLTLAPGETRARELTPAPLNVRSRVHEYGGGAYGVSGDEIVFSDDADRQLRRMQTAGAAVQLSRDSACRYADLSKDAARARWLAVVERHGEGGAVQNYLAAIDAHSGAQQLLASGADFYASPCLTPDASRLAWIEWHHPNMPWDASELWVARLDAGGTIVSRERVAGSAPEAIFQPAWGRDGSLYFVSDRNGYWNLHRWRDGTVQCVYESAHDFGRAMWVFGQTTYACVQPQLLACAYVEQGQWRLGLLDGERGSLRAITLPYTELAYVCSDGSYVYCVAASAQAPDCVLRIEPNSGAHEVLYRSADAPIEASFLSQPQPVTFPSAPGTTAHGFYYPPTHAQIAGPEREAPPLIVIGHGGPTAATSTAFNLGIQFWTSRGFAVLDVNYRGSTGYGRAYRRALEGQWGVADVADCVHGALYLVEQRLAERARLAIRGRSAGGFTVLAALTFHDVFSAGASYYGVSDLEALAQDTHKFEARYLDSLIGPYPQARAVYAERSPLNHCEQLRTPIIFFQGLEDKVVPPNQAERMVAALRARGVQVEYVTFANEQHGFRRAENVQRALEAELDFYLRVFALGEA